MSRRYVKLCDIRDFGDAGLREMIEQMVPGVAPEEQLHRKYWEMAMLGLYLQDAGVLSEQAQALGVAAGQEGPLFWLANRVGHVVATDIYGEGDFSGREAQASMLSDPAALSPIPYREDHLEVRHMDALALDFPDESFDVVFCLSSIEHFGGGPAAARACAEMARVLRPGGHIVITTECLLSRHPLDAPLVNYAIRLASFGRLCAGATPTKRAVDAFTAAELERDLVRPMAAAGAVLPAPLDLELSPESFDNVIHWRGGEPIGRDGRRFPHIVIKGRGSAFTSVFLPFAKRA